MNDTELQELRQDILEEVEDMDIEMLKRIVYECRCEEMGIYPDHTYIRWWWLLKKTESLLTFFSTNWSSMLILICLIFMTLIVVMITFNSNNWLFHYENHSHFY